MRTFFLLFRVQMKNRMGLSALRTTFRTDKKRFWQGTLIAFAAVAGVATLIGCYALLVHTVFGAAAGPFSFVREMVLALLFLLMPLMMLITGTATMLGTLYFGRDVELLAALPARERTVFASKFAQVLFFEYLVVLALCLPPILLYPQAFAFSYLVRAVLVLFLLPFIPLAICAALSLILMRAGALVRHREALMVGGAFLGIGAVLAMQALVLKNAEENFTVQAMLTFLLSRRSLVDLLVSAYPPAGWALRALSGEGVAAFGQLALLALASAVCLALTLLLSGRLYERGLSAAGETAAGGRRRRTRGSAPRRSQTAALFLREWRVALRTPAYAMNALIDIPMAPVMLCMFTFAMPRDVAELAALFGETVDANVVTLGLTALLALVASLNTGGVTAFSREGSLLAFGRSLPVSAYTQALGKHLFGASVALLAVLAGVAAAVPLLHIAPAQAAYAAFTAFFFAAGVNAAGLLFDMYHPRLSWTSPTEAIKQGLNPMMCMIAGFVFAVVAGGTAYLMLRAGLETETVLAGTATVTLLLSALSHTALFALAPRLYAGQGEA